MPYNIHKKPHPFCFKYCIDEKINCGRARRRDNKTILKQKGAEDESIVVVPEGAEDETIVEQEGAEDETIFVQKGAEGESIVVVSE